MANFRKINQLLNNDNDIDDMIAFINTGRQNYPPNVNNISYLTKSNLFHVNNNKLFYQDNKEVVKKVDANQKVQDLYVDKQSGLGRSQRTLYYEVKQRYYNITRKQVITFLKTSPVYNASRRKRPENHYTSKIFKEPKDCYAIDLIDFSKIKTHNANGQIQYRFMFVVIDIFSKYCWLKALPNKEQGTVYQAFDDQLINPNTRPKNIWTDRGLEFNNAQLSALLQQHNINHLFNKPYNPVKYVESFNRNIRKTLRELFLRNNNLVWWNKCDQLAQILNDTQSTITDKKPHELFFLQDQPNNPTYQEVNQKVRQRNAKVHEGNNEHIYQIGDAVLVYLGDVQKDLMKKKKEQSDFKNMPMRWSPETYYIAQIYHQRLATGYTRYAITDDPTGNPVLYLRNDDGSKMMLKGSSLLDANTQQAHNLQFLQGMTQLNKINNPIHLIFT